MTRRAAAAALALLLASGCTTPHTDPGAPSPSPGPLLVQTRCADLVVLALRGSTQSATRNHGAGQEVLASVRAMATELHNRSDATVRIEGIPYRAESAASNAIYQANIDDGRTRTASRLDELGHSCPKTRFALVGFSQGAQVVHELAADLSAGALRRVALVAMISDPRRNPDDEIDSWTYGRPAPWAGKLGPGPVLGPSMRGAAITFCAADDEICNWPPGGHAGGPSATHRHFYETSDHAASTGARMAAVLRRDGS